MLEIFAGISFTFAAASAAIFACDFLPEMKSFFARRKLGSFKKNDEWKAACEKAALKQIKKLPAMPIGDRKYYTFVPRLKGEYRNEKFELWQEAALLLALKENEEAKKAAYQFFIKARLTEKPYTPATGLLLFALLESGFEKDAAVHEACADYCKKALAAAGTGTLPYGIGSSNRYVDTLGMVCPFLVKYSLTYGSMQALELAKRQLDEFYNFGIQPQSGLPAHCYSLSQKRTLGIYGWGRGCGWLSFALSECFRLFNGHDEYSKTLEERMIKLSTSLKRYVRENGSFGSALGTNQPEDSSATAMLGLFLAKAARLEGNNELLAAAAGAFNYLKSVTRKNGTVDFAQGDTHGAGSYSRRFEPLPVSLGFALMLEKEIFENL